MHMKIDKDFFKKLRIEKGFTQQYIADILNISTAALSRVENNPEKARLETILLLVGFYEADIRKMFSDNERDIVNELEQIKVQITLPYNVTSTNLFQLATELKKIEQSKN